MYTIVALDFAALKYGEGLSGNVIIATQLRVGIAI
jgi:hypothetical protein